MGVVVAYDEPVLPVHENRWSSGLAVDHSGYSGALMANIWEKDGGFRWCMVAKVVVSNRMIVAV